MTRAQKLAVQRINFARERLGQLQPEQRKELTADPVLGGGGDKLDETLATAKPILDTFGSPELNKLLRETGIGDNPHFVRFVYNLGVVNSEHDFVKAGKPTKSTPFYDHPTSQPRK